MADPAFMSNPIGHDFDPDELWQRFERDGEEATLRYLQNPVEDGKPRGLDTVPAEYMV
jgi:hypothetical protein